MSSMSSYPTGCTGGATNGASLVDDYSSDFSVVSPPTMSTVYANGDMSNLHELQYDPPSSTSDLSFTQMQEAVHSLLKENADLKDVVQQDHATMKSQYEIMLHSKEQIETFMKRQLEMRDRAKVAIEILKTENNDLKEKLKTMEDVSRNGEKALLEGRLAQLESELEQLRALVIAKNVELERSQVMYQQLLVEKRELASINFDLQAKLTHDKSIDSSEGSDDHEFLIIERKQRSSLNRSSVVLQEGTSQTTMVDENAVNALQDQLTTEQGRTCELNSELNQTRAKLEELNKQVAGQEEVIRRLAAKKSPPPSPNTTFDLGDSIEQELKVSDEKAKLAKSKLERYGRKCDELHQWLEDPKATVASEAARIAMESEKVKLLAEMESLKKALAEEQSLKAASKKQALDAQKELEASQAEFRNYKKNYDVKNVEQASKAKAFQEKQDELFGKYVACQDSLNKRDAELKAALEKLDSRKDDEETIAILRAQVELYKADFQAEREAREQLHGEKENLLAQVKQLQVLVPGSKSYRPGKDGKHDRKERHSKHDKRNSRHGQQPNLEGDQNPEDDQFGAEGAAGGAAAEEELFVDEFPFKCPKCEAGYKEYVPLERHVNICLDLDNPFQ